MLRCNLGKSIGTDRPCDLIFSFLYSIDTSRDRALIKRVRLDNTIPNNGYNYATDGEVFASGLRNEVGLTWDKYGVMCK